MADKGLMAGSADMMILRLLREEDMYGYQIIDMLKKRSQNVFELKAGTLYPLLHTMEEKGLIACYEKSCNGRTRKYYCITDIGERLFAEKKESWITFSRAVDNVISEVCYAYQA